MYSFLSNLYSQIAVYINNKNIGQKIPSPNISVFKSESFAGNELSDEIDPPDPTFYDHPSQLGYSIERRMEGWDQKWKTWLDRSKQANTSGHRITAVGVQSQLAITFYRDFSRTRYKIFLLQPEMGSYWAKLPIILAAMLAHS